MEASHTNQQTGLFFELLRFGLWGDYTQLSNYDEIDYPAILSIAEEQSVVGLITAGLEVAKDEKIPQSVVLQFVGNTLQIEERNKVMNQFVAGIIQRLRDNDVYALLVKGQGIAQCYKKPLWRASGDVDILLSDDNYQKAKDMLIPLASSIEAEDIPEKHIGMFIDGFVVELHGTLNSGLSHRIDNGLEIIKNAIFQEGKMRSWMNEKTQVFLPSADEDVVYVFTHILRHFYRGGIGLRQICDWCRLLWTFRESLDTKLLETRIKQMGIMSEWCAFGVYAVENLGMPKEAMPFYSSDNMWKEKANRINKFILSVGNMGHNRDTSYMEKPYFIRKCYSAGRRIGDLISHAKLFPLDSLRFFPHIMFYGFHSTLKGE